MKNAMKFLSAALALITLIFSLGIGASASPLMDPEPNDQPEQLTGTISREEALANGASSLSRLSESSACFLPYNPGNGTTGETAVEFVADETTAAFTLDCKYDGTYHCQLYRIHTGGGTNAGAAVTSSFGSGPVFSGLIVGATYYIKVSSQDVPAVGTTGDYTLDVYGDMLSPPDATSSTEVKLNTNANCQTITWPVPSGYGYWKIAVANTSPADLTVKIVKGSPSGTEVFGGRVNAGSSFSFYAEDGSPLSSGAHYIIVTSVDSGKTLSGTLWYKFGGSHSDIDN